MTRDQKLSTLTVHIRRTAREFRYFTVADVWASIDDHHFRKTCGRQRLIAIALRLVQKEGLIAPTNIAGHTDNVGHRALRATWETQEAA